jgi:hypothetical protein
VVKKDIAVESNICTRTYCDVHAVGLRRQQRNYCFPCGLFRGCYLVTARHNNEEVFSTGSDLRLYNSEAVGNVVVQSRVQKS